jgi:general secretion pathway protein G
MRNRGFTLIELIMVIAIIGVLVSVIVANLSTSRAFSRDARRASDIRNIQLSLAQYYNDNLKYPCSIYCNTDDATCGSQCRPFFNGTYMASTPLDPDSTKPEYSYMPLGAGGSCYWYHLGAALEKTKSSLSDQDSDQAATAVVNGTTLSACANANFGDSANISANFDGNTTVGVNGAGKRACAGTTADVSGNDPCYDVTPPQ